MFFFVIVKPEFRIDAQSMLAMEDETRTLFRLLSLSNISKRVLIQTLGHTRDDRTEVPAKGSGNSANFSEGKKMKIIVDISKCLWVRVCANASVLGTGIASESRVSADFVSLVGTGV